MIRRLLRALRQLDRHEWVGVACCAVFIGGIVLALGDRQQRDEQAQSPTLTTQDGGRKTAVAAKD